MHLNKSIVIILFALAAGCGPTRDDLFPSSTDKRVVVEQNSTGPGVGQNAPGFSVTDTLGNPVSLVSLQTGSHAVVLYFTMWCPTCDGHMSYMMDTIMPAHPDIAFVAVDYVSGSVDDARNAQQDNGYANSGFIVVADTAHAIQNAYKGTMGTTVVIDKSGVIGMNEDFKNGAKLMNILDTLP